MRILRSNKPVIYEGGYFKPYCRYIVSDFEAEVLIAKSKPDTWIWSSFAPWERRYAGQDLNSKKVCVYRHNAWGDQLIVSAVCAELKRRYPDAILHLYCHNEVLPLWYGNPIVEGSPLPLPIPFDIIHHYDYTIFYEGMLEGNREFDQRCCYDDFFGVIGMLDVADRFKRPSICPHPDDYAVLDRLKLRKLGKYIVYHISPKNMNRCYPPELGRKTLDMLAKLPYRTLLVGMDPEGKYNSVLEGLSQQVINLIGKTENFRELIPIVEGASLVVGPDSAIMHLAAAFDDVPIISLWGLFHPNDRTQYYKNNNSIFKKEVCPHAPCRDHNFFLPIEQCK